MRRRENHQQIDGNRRTGGSRREGASAGGISELLTRIREWRAEKPSLP
jgi:hypothetical protein